MTSFDIFWNMPKDLLGSVKVLKHALFHAFSYHDRVWPIENKESKINFSTIKLGFRVKENSIYKITKICPPSS